jgi:hypothetical protein
MTTLSGVTVAGKEKKGRQIIKITDSIIKKIINSKMSNEEMDH